MTLATVHMSASMRSLNRKRVSALLVASLSLSLFALQPQYCAEGSCRETEAGTGWSLELGRSDEINYYTLIFF